MEKERSPEIDEIFMRILNRDKTIYPYLIRKTAYGLIVFPIAAAIYINNMIAKEFER